MSGIKDDNVAAFYRSLGKRGQGITSLAEAINAGRSHLSQVLSGKRTGKPTWRKLMAAGVLTERELWLLGQGPAPLEELENVPRDTNSHMEHTQQEVA